MGRPAKKNIDAELFFRALADRTRLRLLNLMGAEEVCVCFFVEILGVSQPKVSHHLAYLRRAGIVAARREGTWMHYRVVAPPDAEVARVLEDVLAWLARDPEMRKDRKRLIRFCFGPRAPISLFGAPRPGGLSADRTGAPTRPPSRRPPAAPSRSSQATAAQRRGAARRHS